MTQIDTKTRILDCAEQMFAHEGFHNTSLRKLTALAGANLASVNYHFGTKEALLQAVIERRLLPLNKIRKLTIEQVLKDAQKKKIAPVAADVLRAFIVPTLEFRHSSKGAKDFISLIGRSLSEPDETVRTCFINLAMPNFQLLFTALHQTLPQLPEPILLARLQFIMGTLSHVMCMSSNSLFNRPELPTMPEQTNLVEQLLSFVQAGLEAPL